METGRMMEQIRNNSLKSLKKNYLHTQHQVHLRSIQRSISWYMIRALQIWYSLQQFHSLFQTKKKLLLWQVL